MKLDEIAVTEQEEEAFEVMCKRTKQGCIEQLEKNDVFTLSNPMHPGEFLKEAYMKPMFMNVTELAEKLGVSKSSVSRLVTGKSELSYEMAIRLSKVFNRSPEGWMALQTAYGFRQAKDKMERMK